MLLADDFTGDGDLNGRVVPVSVLPGATWGGIGHVGSGLYAVASAASAVAGTAHGYPAPDEVVTNGPFTVEFTWTAGAEPAQAGAYPLFLRVSAALWVFFKLVSVDGNWSLQMGSAAEAVQVQAGQTYTGTLRVSDGSQVLEFLGKTLSDSVATEGGDPMDCGSVYVNVSASNVLNAIKITAGA